MFTTASAFALFFMLALAGIASYVATKLKQPYTVVLVLLGIVLAAASYAEPLRFLREFHLTPELLFFIFLPTLLFESAYNMNIRRIVDDWRPIMLLAVGGLLVSAFTIGGALWGVFALLGLSVPFTITLLFGALISATDPVAVLALFKEYGAPRRLTLLFEGESIANDATSLALFLVVLGLVGQQITALSLATGGVVFATMLFGGALVGLLVGAVFIAFIGMFREDEVVAITLMLVLAHLTFLIAEGANEIAQHAGVPALQFSPIIATTVASLLMGNYGRFKITPRAEEFVDKFWTQFAFMANSLVFILVGFLAASLPAHSSSLLVPALVTVLIVALARALSIYGIIVPYNFFATAERRVPTAWQHLLSWGSLRGALAVMLVLLVPAELAVDGWGLEVSVRDFLLVLTLACVFATLFVKATTIGPIMRRLKVDALTPLEDAAESEAASIIHAITSIKLRAFAEKGYVPSEVATHMIAEHERAFGDVSKKITTDTASPFTLRALRLYLIGLEKEVLKDLFAFDEIPERVFRRIHGKLTLQSEAIERGDAPDKHRVRDKRDLFENAAEYVYNLVSKENQTHAIEDEILYYRAQAILSRKVLKELSLFENEFKVPVFSPQILSAARAEYYAWRAEANEKVVALRANSPHIARTLDERLAHKSALRVEKHYLESLSTRGLLTPKLFIKLEQAYEERSERPGA